MLLLGILETSGKAQLLTSCCFLSSISFSGISLCGYLGVLAKNGLVHLIYAYPEVTVAGVHFYRNGGYTKIAKDEADRKQKEQVIIDKQLEAATISAGAADKTARYPIPLLWITAINVLAVIVTTFYQLSDPPPTQTNYLSKKAKVPGGFKEITPLDSLATQLNHTLKIDTSH